MQNLGHMNLEQRIEYKDAYANTKLHKPPNGFWTFVLTKTKLFISSVFVTMTLLACEYDTGV